MQVYYNLFMFFYFPIALHGLNWVLKRVRWCEVAVFLKHNNTIYHFLSQFYTMLMVKHMQKLLCQWSELDWEWKRINN